MARSPLACLAAGAVLSCLSAYADDVGQTFAPADFERFAPLTALDMVRQVPGFEIQREDGARGLGQASGNVLINGERPSGKSNDAVDALGRIPANRVSRIELVDGSTLGIPGLTGRVVNVVTEGTGISGVWEWRPRFRERLEPRYNEGEASVTGQMGNLDWTLGLESRGNRFGNAGPEFVRDGAGTLVEVRDEDLEGAQEFLEGSVSLSWAPPNGHEANFNATYADFNFNRRLIGERTPVDGDAITRRFWNGEDEWNSEIGADYAFPALGGALKLIGLYRHEDSRLQSSVLAFSLADGSQVEGRRFKEDFIENEAVGRAEFDWAWTEGRDWQVAFETAYNRLDAGSDVLSLDADEIETLLDRALPTLVEETRYELSATHSRPLTQKLALQVSLAGESSEISSEVGDTSQSESFLRPKGYVSLAYDHSDWLTSTLRIEREVGQLSFFQFVSTQDIDNDLDRAGNRELVPDQTWRFENEFDAKFGDLGAATLTVFHEEIEDLVDRVPTGDGRDAIGNIDSARLSGLELSTTLNLDRFGLEGVQVQLEGEAIRSRVDDPLTGEERRISGEDISFTFAEIRWDIPNTPYAILVAGEQFRDGRRFRLNEISQFTASDPFVWVQAEHKDFYGFNVAVRIANLLDQKDQEFRERFSPDRTGELIQTREFARDFGYILRFDISSSF